MHNLDFHTLQTHHTQIKTKQRLIRAACIGYWGRKDIFEQVLYTATIPELETIVNDMVFDGPMVNWAEKDYWLDEWRRARV